VELIAANKIGAGAIFAVLGLKCPAISKASR
jgi:hypothetical protein